MIYLMAFLPLFIIIVLGLALGFFVNTILPSMIKTREDKKDNFNPLSPTLQWMNTAGALVLAQGFCMTSEHFRYMAGCLFPGSENNPRLIQAVKKMLWDYWEIQSHEQAIEEMTYLLHTGMRARYGKEMCSFETVYHNYSEQKLIEIAKEKNPNANEDSFLPKMIMAYRRYGENALLGWDVGRIGYVIQCCYVAGYVSMEEVLELGVEAGEKAQKCFNNWEEMMESYLLGVQYWQREDANNPKSMTAKRWKLYEKLWKGKKPYKEIPYMTVGFATPLSKKIITDKYGIMPEYQKYYEQE